MEKFSLFISKKAQKELEELPALMLRRFDKRLLELIDNPFPTDSKKLSGSLHTYRLREGDYRLVYTVEEATITVLRVRHRKDVYR
ncbi:MAG: type II toxin-antitoxin system RelE/ParE family toxin [Candidatus Margulisiibacteriota bacterium]